MIKGKTEKNDKDLEGIEINEEQKIYS